MSNWIGAIIIVLVFIYMLNLLRLVENSLMVITQAKKATQVLSNSELDDLQKEKALQKNALTLFKLFFIILLSSLLAIAVPLGIVWILEKLGLMSLNSVIDFTLSWAFIISSSVIISLAVWIFRKKKSGL